MAGKLEDKRKKAVVLTSGGLDSTTCIAIALSENRDVYPLSIEYGQKHSAELRAIHDVVMHYIAKSVEATPYGNTTHVKGLKTVKVDLRAIGGSALTDDKYNVPLERSSVEMSKEIPITYVPARNTIMLSIAMGYAEVVGAEEIWIGVNQLDYSGYPDCREEFLEQFAILANLATKAGVEGKVLKIKAPLLKLTKAKIIKRGLDLNVPYNLTWSCYTGGEKPCGQCDSCILRLAGFKEAGSQDPVTYS
jgi:7-cyano-7-deazaguanine synthase